MADTGKYTKKRIPTNKKEVKMSQETQNREKLLKLLAQSEDDVARGRIIRQKDLFDYLERGVAPNQVRGRLKRRLKPRRGGSV